MKRATRIGFLAWLGVLCALHAAAPSAWAVFDDLPLSARARSMGQAMVTTVNDAWAYYYNPSMLPRLGGFSGGVATVSPNGHSFNRLTSIAVASALGQRSGVAFGWRRYAVEHGNVDLSTENTLSVSHGFMLFSDASTSASFGWTLNFYHLDFAPTIGLAGDGSNGQDPGSTWTYGVDVGGSVTVYDRTCVGFFTRNLNNPTMGEDEEELRREIGVGISYQPYPGVTTALDLRNGLKEEFRFLGGMEFEIIPELLLRFGLETEPSKITGGFAVNVPKATIEYGFSTGGGVLESSHHFGLVTHLNLFGEGAQ